jgi:queuine/archaeosine tRNA-ribosyltransferase
LFKQNLDLSSKDWILDSGAFGELYQHGKYTYSIEDYLSLVSKYQPPVFVSMDYPCESKILFKTGKSIKEHQNLTTENHLKIRESLEKFGIESQLMGVIQGWKKEEYLEHLDSLKAYGLIEKYMGIGSICRGTNRGTNLREVAEIITEIRKILPGNIKLHGFGVKISLFKSNPRTIKMLDSADSMDWSLLGRRHIFRKDSKCSLTREKCTFPLYKHCGNCYTLMLYWRNRTLKLIQSCQLQSEITQFIK